MPMGCGCSRQSTGIRGRVYIVENELVFSYLVERLKGGKHSESCPAEDGEARAGEGACGVSGKYAGGAGEGYWRDR